MSVIPVGAVASSGFTAGLTGLEQVSGSRSTSSTGSSAFSTVLGAIDQVQGLQNTSSQLAVKAVTGDLNDVHDYTIAATQASVALELTAAVRNKAVEAFTEIMRMQA